MRPTAVFGRGNRGNIYNLFNQIANRGFVFIGSGKNKKSIAYIENVASFLEFTLGFGSGLYIYNYIDKPDYDMQTLVCYIKKLLGKKRKTDFKLPYFAGYLTGALFDFLSFVTGRKFPISRIRIDKFCSSTVFSAAKLQATGFNPPFTLAEGIAKFIQAEFRN